MKFETLCLHGGYQAEPTTRARAVPVYRTSSFQFRNTEHAANLFALKELGNIYTRLMNPTTDVLEKRVSLLEGAPEPAGLGIASGTSAVFYSIINVASAAAHHGLRDHAAYCASKGGLLLLTKVLALEWAPHGINVNAVAPTVILTPMGEKVWGAPEKRDPMLAKIPAGRFGKPVDVSGAILFLASPASDLIHGETLVADGGYVAQ